MRVNNVLVAKERRLISIAPEASVKEALALFVEHNIGSLPVVDASGKLSGSSLSVTCFTGTIATPCGSSPAHQRSHDARPLHLQLQRCRARSHGRGVTESCGQLPVVNEGKLVGLVSVGDLIKSLYNHAEAANQQLTAFLYGPG